MRWVVDPHFPAVEAEGSDTLTHASHTAASPTKDKFSSVHIALSTSDYGTLGSRMSTLLIQILDSLSALEKLHLLSTPSGSTLPEELALLGFTILTTTPSSLGTSIVTQKPARSYSLTTRSPVGTVANDTGAGAISMPLLQG